MCICVVQVYKHSQPEWESSHHTYIIVSLTNLMLLVDVTNVILMNLLSCCVLFAIACLTQLPL